MKHLSVLLVPVFAVVGLGTIDPTPSPVPAQPKTSVSVKDVVSASNQFGLDLYAQLRTQSAGNLSLSPLSLSTGLAMVHAGAWGEPRAEMARVLHLPGAQAALEPA